MDDSALSSAQTMQGTRDYISLSSVAIRSDKTSDSLYNCDSANEERWSPASQTSLQCHTVFANMQ